MILSDLLGTEVHEADGTRVGRVIDARFRLEGNTSPSQARLVGVIVSRSVFASFLGYERTVASRPVLLDRILRMLHRGSFLVLWADIARIEPERVLLRSGYERQPSALDREEKAS
ncbi:MAG TPA: PRC-barrel domain containing protein [Protaetiibacter sp.]|nr:PRC-barrel domain containing protein [Protaetiibacter sp.]